MQAHRDQDVYGEPLQPWQWNDNQHSRSWASDVRSAGDNTEADELAKGADTMHLGDMRFLVAVFGLLNYPRIIRMDAPAPKKIRSIRWGRPVPRNEVKVVEVDLPKKRGVNLHKQLFTGHGSPQRQHVRRGYWRKIKDAQGRIIRERRVKPYVAGNPELGIIEHEYFLKAGGDKYQKEKA